MLPYGNMASQHSDSTAVTWLRVDLEVDTVPAAGSRGARAQRGSSSKA